MEIAAAREHRPEYQTQGRGERTGHVWVGLTPRDAHPLGDRLERSQIPEAILTLDRQGEAVEPEQIAQLATGVEVELGGGVPKIPVIFDQGLNQLPWRIVPPPGNSRAG